MRRLLLIGLAMLMWAPLGAHALSLGNLELKSALHQPLDARIPILSATGEEMDTLTVRVAPAAEFARAGVNYSGILTQFNFDIVQTRSGPDYIRITSRDPVKEPFLDFLIEVNWAKGRIIREYTALVDPPLYDPSRSVSWSAATVKPSAVPAPATAPPREMRVGGAAAPPPTPTAAPPRAVSAEAKVTTAPTAAPSPSAAGTYPTLWTAATSMRPNSSVSIQQMMIAMFRANPDAFIRDNINLLKKGYVLKMPDQSAIAAISRAEALAEVKKHHSLWQEYRARGAASAPKQPEGAAVASTAPQPRAEAQPSATPAPTPETEAKLKLVGSSDGAGAGAAGGSSSQATAEELALTKETLESKQRENEELRTQLAESEEIIEKLKSRIALQDDQLAQLQRKLSETGGGTPDTTPLPEAAPPETMAATASSGSEVWRSLENEVQIPAGAPPVSVAAMPAPSAPMTVSPEPWRALDDEVYTPTGPPPAAVVEVPAEEVETVAVAPAEQPTPSELATPPVEAAAPPPSEEVSAPPEERAVAEVAPPIEAAPPAEVTGTEEGGGWIATLNSILGAVIPRALLDSVPGGALTLLGALVAALAAIIALLTRRRAEPAPESVPTIAFEEEAYDEALSAMTAPDMAAAVAPSATADEDLFGEISAEQRSVTVPITEAKRAEAAAEDPLAEVNVYLAYERFDEAERLIKEAIANYPNEHKYKLRLLEVYYSSNNRPGYEAAARELHNAVGGSGPLWDSAVAMWREMSPNRALFAGGEEPATQVSVPAGARQIVDITALEERTGRTVTSAVASMPAAEAGVDIPLTETAAEAQGGGLDFDLDTGGGEGVIDISGSAESDIGDSLFDISVGGPAEADSLLEISVPSMIEGASPAVNELLSLTKSGAVQPADSDLAALMQSSLELGEADVTSSLTDDMNLAEATANPEDMLDFDLGGGFASTPTKPEDSNVVEFPAKQDAMPSASKPSVDTLSTMIDVAPLPEAKPDEFDIGELDLALTGEPATHAAAREEQSLDLSLDSGGSAEVTVGDIDSMGLDEDTVRLFENDLAATSGQEAMPPFRTDNGAAVTSDDLLFNEQTLSKSIPGLALEQDDISLDDITKSLEETVGAKQDKEDFDTVDLSLDSGNMSEIEETAELFKDDLRPGPGAEETLGALQSPFAEGPIGGDDVDTKLNLAKAYVELGDAAGARTILDEVANEGSEMQREEARRLLRELTT